MGTKQSVEKSTNSPKLFINDFHTDNSLFLDEILRIIFSFAIKPIWDQTNTISFSQVCHQWRRIIRKEIGLPLFENEIEKWKHLSNNWKFHSFCFRKSSIPLVVLQHESTVKNLESIEMTLEKKQKSRKYIQTIATFKNLQNLRLSCSLDLQDFQMIGQSENMKTLKRIYLENQNGCLTDEQVVALCSSNLSNLEDFSLKYFSLTKYGLNVLVESFKLKALSLLVTYLRDEDLTIIFNSPNMVNLELLNLNMNLLTSKGLNDLAHSKYIKKLTSLDISRNHDIGNEGFSELVKSENISNIKCLRASNCAIQLDGIISLANSSYLSNLTELVLSSSGQGSSQIINEAFTYLVSSNKMLNLQILKLQEIGIEDCDQALSQLQQYSHNLPKLEHLELRHNNVGIKSIDKLINLSKFKCLIYCCVRPSISESELKDLNKKIREIHSTLTIL